MQKVSRRDASSSVDFAGIAFTAALFWIHDNDDRCTINGMTTQRCREKAVCTDSESQGLATKKFSSSPR
jgi:hypothetical protein